MCFISMYRVLKTLSEYTCFYIPKNITSYKDFPHCAIFFMSQTNHLPLTSENLAFFNSLFGEILYH